MKRFKNILYAFNIQQCKRKSEAQMLLYFFTVSNQKAHFRVGVFKNENSHLTYQCLATYSQTAG